MTTKILQGNVFDLLPTLKPGSVDCVVTSPPYWALRSYLPKDHPLKPLELGSEKSPAEYVASMVRVFGLVRECLADHGTVWLNIGDAYSAGQRVGHGTRINNKQQTNAGTLGFDERPNPPGLDSGNLCLIPQRLALALQEDGWICRSVICWHKPAPMPSSVMGWFFARHRITIKQYEDLQRLQKGSTSYSLPTEDVRSMPGLRTGEVASLPENGSVPDGKKKVSRKRKGKSNRTGTDKAPGCDGKETGLFPDSRRQGIPEEIRSNTKWEEEPQGSSGQVSKDRKGEAKGQSSGRKAGQRSEANCSTESGMEEVSQLDQGQNPKLETRGSQEGKSNERGTSSEHGRLAGDCPATEGPLQLVQEEKTADDRSCHSIIKGRPTHENQRGRSVPVMQHQQGSKDPDSVLIDCPGCPKCEPNGGYVLRKGSWRPTSSWEPILMLAKSEKYFSDGEAVKQPVKESSLARVAQNDGHPIWNTDPQRDFNGSPQTFDINAMVDPSGANLRDVWRTKLEDMTKEDLIGFIQSMADGQMEDVWRIAAEPLREKHFASFPSELVHRCLKAATSAKGYCPQCGGPWVRVIESESRQDQEEWSGAGRANGCMAGGGHYGRTGQWSQESKTIDWRPSCACMKNKSGDPCGEDEVGSDDPHGKPRPGLVLDPFAGSGRTGIEAKRLGLDFVGLELNPAYCEMARRLLREQMPLFG